jgi:(1->4)-alpha-D-glucan 1-alpha-D-glucosylmutase
MGVFLPLCRRLTRIGYSYGLAQVVLKAACPGVPDIYQGVECWDLSFVDPDNRRPVDFLVREKTLGELDAAFAADPVALCHRLLASPEDGCIKLFTLWRALAARGADPELFTVGAYAPAAFAGSLAGNAFGFWRAFEGRMALAVVPWRIADLGAAQGSFVLGEAWEDARVADLPEGWGPLTDVMTGRTFSGEGLMLKELLRDFPVALLTGGTAGGM